MQNVIKELLTIEKSARKSVAFFESDNRFIHDEIEKGITALERDANERIKTSERESLAETQERLTQIKKMYQRKTDELEAAFLINHESWLEKIVQEILAV